MKSLCKMYQNNAQEIRWDKQYCEKYNKRSLQNSSNTNWFLDSFISLLRFSCRDRLIRITLLIYTNAKLLLNTVTFDSRDLSTWFASLNRAAILHRLIVAGTYEELHADLKLKMPVLFVFRITIILYCSVISLFHFILPIDSSYN